MASRGDHDARRPVRSRVRASSSSIARRDSCHDTAATSRHSSSSSSRSTFCAVGADGDREEASTARRASAPAWRPITTTLRTAPRDAPDRDRRAGDQQVRQERAPRSHPVGHGGHGRQSVTRGCRRRVGRACGGRRPRRGTSRRGRTSRRPLPTPSRPGSIAPPVRRRSRARTSRLRSSGMRVAWARATSIDRCRAASAASRSGCSPASSASALARSRSDSTNRSPVAATWRSARSSATQRGTAIAVGELEVGEEHREVR